VSSQQLGNGKKWKIKPNGRREESTKHKAENVAIAGTILITNRIPIGNQYENSKELRRKVRDAIGTQRKTAKKHNRSTITAYRS
jgi:hypothetical protein